MKYTNIYGLPDTIVQAVKNDSYNAGKTDFSATTLLKPPRIVMLEKRHRDELVEDISDNIWRLLGQATHSILERTTADNALMEERIFTEIKGKTISGATDLFKDKVITDYKVTSAWTLVYGSRTKEWEEQLNIYAYLFRKQGFEVEKLHIVTILRDWSKTNALKDSKYPQCAIQTIHVELWDYEVQKQFLEERVQAMIDAENLSDSELPKCTPEEQWAQPTKYAIMKKSRKSAVRVLAGKQEAEDMLSELDNKHYLEVRPGKCTRCEDYCNVNKFCSQYLAMKEMEVSA